jgi:hypothetical protein
MTIGYKIWGSFILASILGLALTVKAYPDDAQKPIDEIKPTFIAVEDGTVKDYENFWILSEKKTTVTCPLCIIKAEHLSAAISINMPHYCAVYQIVGQSTVSFDDNDIVLSAGQCVESDDLSAEYYSFMEGGTQKLVIRGQQYSVWLGTFNSANLLTRFNPGMLANP